MSGSAYALFYHCPRCRQGWWYSIYTSDKVELTCTCGRSLRQANLTTMQKYFLNGPSEYREAIAARPEDQVPTGPVRPGRRIGGRGE